MLHTQLPSRVPLSAGILPERAGQDKVQGNMPSLRPRRASCHSDADLAQEMGTSGSLCDLQKVPSWYLYWPHMVRGSSDSVQAQMFRKRCLDLWEGCRGLSSQGRVIWVPRGTS